MHQKSHASGIVAFPLHRNGSSATCFHTTWYGSVSPAFGTTCALKSPRLQLLVAAFIADLPALLAPARLNESKRPLLIATGKLPLMPLVDRPHGTPDFGPTERGKAVQLKCLVLCPYTADPRIMAAMPRGRACPFAAGPRTTPSFLPTITRSRPILQGYTQCTRWQERDGGSWTARNGEGGVLARFCLAPPPFSVVSPFECLSSLRVRHAIPPVREPSVQGAFRCRLEPRGV